VHDIWIVRVSREIAAHRNNVDKAKLSAEWERAARSFVEKKKTAHYSIHDDESMLLDLLRAAYSPLHLPSLYDLLPVLQAMA